MALTVTSSDLWLLHHLYLPLINDNCRIWIATWNHHTMTSMDTTPYSLYTHGTALHGVRSLSCDVPLYAPTSPSDPVTLSEDEILSYGVDWDGMENQRLYQHYMEENYRYDLDNVEIEDPSNFYDISIPEQLSHVQVIPARCPFEEA